LNWEQAASLHQRGDANKTYKRRFLDLEGNISNNKILDNGKQKGRTNDEYQKITHFNIE